MSDLSSLMSIAPTTAAGMMGRNQAQSRQSEYLKQQELRQMIAAKLQEMQQSQQMNPLKLEQQTLQNQGLRAGLPGITADSQTKELGAQFTQATQPTAIDATNAKNTGVVDKEKYEKVNRFQQWAMEAGAALEQTPPILRKQTLMEKMKTSGINPENPMSQNLLKELGQKDPQEWPSYFMKLSDKLGQMTAQQNPAYRSATENSIRSDATSRRNADVSASTSRYVADKSAESRLAVARERGAAKGAGGSDFWSSYYKTRGALKQYNALTSEAAKLMQGDEDDRDEAQKLLQMRQALRKEAEAELNMRRNPSAINPEAIMPGAGVEPLTLGDGGPTPAGAAQVGPPTGKTKSGASYTIIKE